MLVIILHWIDCPIPRFLVDLNITVASNFADTKTARVLLHRVNCVRQPFDVLSWQDVVRRLFGCYVLTSQTLFRHNIVYMYVQLMYSTLYLL